MKRQRYLYHVTEAENVESILKNGLRRDAKRKTSMVYLSTRPLSWYKNGLRILKVDVSGLLHIKANTFLPDSDEVVFWGDIPAKKGFKRRISDVTDLYVGDLVQVIRCKDCIYYRNHPNGLCYAWTEPYDNEKGYKGDVHCVEPDDYCSFAERKKEGK